MINSQPRTPNPQIYKFVSLIIVCNLVFGIFTLYAQDNNKLVDLTKTIIEAKNNQQLYPVFEELKELYLKENKYTEFVEFLESLATKKKDLEPVINYYIAFSRYYQLKHLEETQNWDEYFSQGNTYRDQIIEKAQKTIETLSSSDALHLGARMILWQFHKDQDDVFKDTALLDLMNAALAYSQEAKDLGPIKDIADRFLSYGERAKSKELYKIYVNKLTASDIKDAGLKDIAANFYQEANIELSQIIYDVYIERAVKSLPKEKLMPALIAIAKLFAYKDAGLKDVFFAEKIFKQVEDLSLGEAFDEELIYLRAFNLEKARQFSQAKDYYLDLVQRYPQTSHLDEVYFKLGIIYTYVLRDIKSGRDYFGGLAQKEIINPWVISSLYQLGLLSQWQEDYAQAKEYYQKLTAQAQDNFKETVALTQERLKEIGQSKPIEYSLKAFLDASLKEECAMFDMSKVGLNAFAYKAKIGDAVNITSAVYTAPSGCMQVELQYLWSGHLGSAKPTSEPSSLNTEYSDKGTKEINLVVVSPAGIIDRGLDILDVD